MTVDNGFYLAVYNGKDECVGVFESYEELANARIVGNTAKPAFLKQKFSHYIKRYSPKPFVTEEGNTRYYSVVIYSSPPKRNNDKRFTKRKYSGYTVYKFWEENI